MCVQPTWVRDKCAVYTTIGIFASFLILSVYKFFRKVMGRPLSNEVYELLLFVYLCVPAK